MYLAIATTLVVGLTVVVIFSATLSYVYSREAAKDYADTQQQYQGKLAKSDHLERSALDSLAEGLEIRPVIDRWRQHRAAEFPEKGWSWTGEDLDTWRRGQLAELKQRLTSRLLFRGVVGIAVIFIFFGGAAIGQYAYFSANRAPTLPPATVPSVWSAPVFSPPLDAGQTIPYSPPFPSPDATETPDSSDAPAEPEENSHLEEEDSIV